MRFRFSLLPVKDILPWGKPPNESLSWFSLSDAAFWIDLGHEELFRLTPEIAGRLWSGRVHPEYPVAAFVRDLVPPTVAGCSPLPPELERFCEDWEGLLAARRASSDWINPEDDTQDCELAYDGWDWFDRRELSAGFLRDHPSAWCLRIGDKVRVVYDNRDIRTDGIPVWTAQLGCVSFERVDVAVAVEAFITDVLAAMDARIEEISAGRVQPRVAVNTSWLAEEQKGWGQEFREGLEPQPEEVSWDRTLDCLRQLARHVGFKFGP